MYYDYKELKTKQMYSEKVFKKFSFHVRTRHKNSHLVVIWQKNGYFIGSWHETDYLVEIWQQNGYLVGIWQKIGYLVGSCQKFLAEGAHSCKNLPESGRFLQDIHLFLTRNYSCQQKMNITQKFCCHF